MSFSESTHNEQTQSSSVRLHKEKVATAVESIQNKRKLFKVCNVMSIRSLCILSPRILVINQSNDPILVLAFLLPIELIKAACCLAIHSPLEIFRRQKGIEERKGLKGAGPDRRQIYPSGKYTPVDPIMSILTMLAKVS